MNINPVRVSNCLSAKRGRGEREAEEEGKGEGVPVVEALQKFV